MNLAIKHCYCIKTIFYISFVFICSCNNYEYVDYKELYNSSDVIALVKLTGIGNINKSKPKEHPKSCKAIVLERIKGQIKSNIILSAVPYSKNNDVFKMGLRDGKHIVFLKVINQKLKINGIGGLLEINKDNIIYPLWKKQDEHGGIKSIELNDFVEWLKYNE